MAQPGFAPDIPVICIGNLVVGGAGKTPVALEVAELCRKLGRRPGFLSRGYGGSVEGPVIVSPALTAADVGDEALLLAAQAPVVVAADRVSGAKLMSAIGIDAIVMDDGFQNPSLGKDLSIVVVDAERGIGNGLVFPAGPLRALLPAQMRLAHALVVLGDGEGGAPVRAAARAGLPILRGRTEPIRRRALKQKPYLAFAGIAQPEKFFATLAAAGASIGSTVSFPDHHPFSETDCEMLLAEAARRQLSLITTAKDRARLRGRAGVAARLAAATETLAIRIRFDEPKRLTALLSDALEAHAGAYRRALRVSPAAVPVPA